MQLKRKIFSNDFVSKEDSIIGRLLLKQRLIVLPPKN